MMSDAAPVAPRPAVDTFLTAMIRIVPVLVESPVTVTSPEVTIGACVVRLVVPPFTLNEPSLTGPKDDTVSEPAAVLALPDIVWPAAPPVNDMDPAASMLAITLPPIGVLTVTSAPAAVVVSALVMTDNGAVSWIVPLLVEALLTVMPLELFCAVRVVVPPTTLNEPTATLPADVAFSDPAVVPIFPATAMPPAPLVSVTLPAAPMLAIVSAFPPRAVTPAAVEVRAPVVVVPLESSDRAAVVVTFPVVTLPVKTCAGAAP